MAKSCVVSSLPCLMIVVLLAGCGDTAVIPTPSPTPGTPATMSGNYFIAANSAVAPQNSFTLGGKIQSNPDNTLLLLIGFISSPPDPGQPVGTCFSVDNEQGTVSGQNALSMSLLPPAGVTNLPAINIVGQVTADGTTIPTGSYTVTGGAAICALNDHGSVTGFMVQPMTGTYTGSFVVNSTTVNISVVLTQLDVAGRLDLRANAIFTNGGACNLTSASTATVEAEPTGSVRGTAMGFGLQDPANPGGLVPNFIASFGGTATDRSANKIAGTITMDGGPCLGQTAPLTLTRM